MRGPEEAKVKPKVRGLLLTSGALRSASKPLPLAGQEQKSMLVLCLRAVLHVPELVLTPTREKQNRY